jgi:hypothetical protein
MVNKVVQFSLVTPRRQHLIRVSQALGFGTIHNIQVRHGDPILESASILSEERLDRAEEPRTEISLNDFLLSKEWCRLLARLDEVPSATISRLEVRAGIPRRVVFESIWKNVESDESPSTD